MNVSHQFSSVDYSSKNKIKKKKERKIEFTGESKLLKLIKKKLRQLFVFRHWKRFFLINRFFNKQEKLLRSLLFERFKYFYKRIDRISKNLRKYYSICFQIIVLILISLNYISQRNFRRNIELKWKWYFRKFNSFKKMRKMRK